MKKTGFAFHCHHDTLFEYVTDYDERVRYIKEDKPEREQELRLKLFKIIPDDRLPTKLVKAREAACDKAGEAYDKAWEAYVKAREAYKPEIEALHKELCPGCPWDGKTIFPKGG